MHLSSLESNKYVSITSYLFSIKIYYANFVNKSWYINISQLSRHLLLSVCLDCILLILYQLVFSSIQSFLRATKRKGLAFVFLEKSKYMNYFLILPLKALLLYVVINYSFRDGDKYNLIKCSHCKRLTNNLLNVYCLSSLRRQIKRIARENAFSILTKLEEYIIKVCIN